MNRRSFLKRAAATAAVVGAPTIVPSSVFGGEAPSNTVQIAGIGVGGRGGGHIWDGFVNNNPGVRVVAVCDCFKSRREDLAKRINDHYGSRVCRPVADFREVLAADDVDGVVVSTQDHWHVPIAYYAAVAGKDMYVEKPLGVAMAWAWKLRDVIKAKGVIFQYGTQQRSDAGFRRAVNLVRNGYIGKVKHIDAWAAGMRAPGWYETEFNNHYKNTESAEVPTDLDYDMWIGPAPMKPYTTSRCTCWGTYHIYDYALGFIAGWGAHPLDIAQWGLDKDHSSPIKYEGSGKMPPEGLFDTTDYWDVNCTYADGVTMRFMCMRAAEQVVGKLDQRLLPFQDHGTRFVGDDGWICVSRYGVYASTRELARMDIKDTEESVYNSPSQSVNFVECIRSRKPTINPIESAIRSDTISHMADISIRTGKTIQWDPENERIVDNTEAAKMLDRSMREPWALA